MHGENMNNINLN